jgi:hypothetical protein
MAKVEDVQNEVDPQIYADYKSLKQDMKEQKEENEGLYKVLMKQKQETALQREKVEFCRNAVEQMEEHVGMIANNPNYKLEELEKLYTASPAETVSPMVGNENLILNTNSQPATGAAQGSPSK